MASDERDRNFDKAIARHLRAAAASGETASEAASSFSHRESCPDAETLAAYHERSLLPAEMNSWKEHIVGCAHCQELLAHLELTDDIPLQAAAEQAVFAETVARPAAASPTPRPATAQADSVRAARRPGGARWRLLVPASAIAAGLLVWIALHEKPQTVLPSPSEVQIAKNQEPPAPAPPVATGAPTSESRPRLTAPSSPDVTDEIASSRRSAAAAADAAKEGRFQNYSAKVVPPAHVVKEEGKRQKDTERDSAASALLTENRADLDGKTSNGALQQRVQVQAQAPSVAANDQSQIHANANVPKVPGPAPLGQAGAAAKKMQSTAPAPSAPAAAARRTVNGLAIGGAAETVMVISDPTRIYSPGANSVWHAGHAGLIEFSPDGGRSWSRQPSGVLVDLLTGSAPSEKICWIVGRVGAILLTTDGGAHWKTISSPLKEDLGGIEATDELHATVWNVQNKKRFSTSDGGLTWERVAP